MVGAQLLNSDMTSLLIRDLYNHPYNHPDPINIRKLCTVSTVWIQVCTLHLRLDYPSKGRGAIGNDEFLFRNKVYLGKLSDKVNIDHTDLTG